MVQDNAPETFEDVFKTYKLTCRLVIWSGASESTIWGSREANWLFRAWHDYAHILSLGEFTPEGERLAALKQMSQSGTILAKVINIEVNEQVKYFQQYNKFPENQIEFFKEKAKDLLR